MRCEEGEWDMVCAKNPFPHPPSQLTKYDLENGRAATSHRSEIDSSPRPTHATNSFTTLDGLTRILMIYCSLQFSFALWLVSAWKKSCPLGSANPKEMKAKTEYTKNGPQSTNPL
jgi:hypothetical protein